MSESTARELAGRLRGWQHADGGWGYGPGRTSRLEPTCWAMLALRAIEPSVRSFGLETLERWPREGAWLRESASTPPNVAFAALALLVHSTAPQPSASPADLQQGRQAIVALEPLTAAPTSVSRQDNRLRGWPWTAGEFSFAEPTAWCLLALKKTRGRGPRSVGPADEAARISEAERMLVDRVCAGGGWNHGNSNVFGTELNAYVPTTALALLALQDRRELPAVASSLRYLREHGRSEPSVLALALATICARVYGEPTDGLVSALEQAVAGDGVGTTVAAWAAAACAMSEEATHAFTL